MYLQITTRCNMTCAHCCFAATNKGDDMSCETFTQALDLASNYGEYVTIGGGEPTCHKDFIPFVGKAIEYFQQGRLELEPLVITNGKVKTKVHKLLDMIEEDDAPLYVDLSQDDWHDPIDPGVVQRFRAHHRKKIGWSTWTRHTSRIGIRTVSTVVPVGRAADPARGLVVSADVKCCCEDILVAPDGTLFSCGCKHTAIGHVSQGWPKGYDREYAHVGGSWPELQDEDLAELAA